MASEVALPRIDAPELERFKPRSNWFKGLRNFVVRKPLGAFGALIILVMVMFAAITFAGLTDNITGYRYDDQVLKHAGRAAAEMRLVKTQKAD